VLRPVAGAVIGAFGANAATTTMLKLHPGAVTVTSVGIALR
jgi:hypothetical protein